VNTPRWEDRWPGRYQYELDALQAAGIRFEVDQQAIAHRILHIRFVHLVDGVEVRGYAVYPHLFPDFRPAVQADALGLTHHQNPLGGNLCLLGRGGDRWRPSYTLAWLLTKQLPLVLASGSAEASDEAVSLEDAQGEPYSAYVPSVAGSAILVDGQWALPAEIKWGRLVIGTREAGPVSKALQAAVLEITDADGNALALIDPALARLYSNKRHACWARSDLTKPEDLKGLVSEAMGLVPGPARKSWPQIHCDGGALRLLGIVIPEEVGHRRSGQGWIFAMLLEESMTRKKRKRGRRQGERPGARVGFARPVYAGRDDLSVRVPELAPLRTNKIAVFGLGSLGAPATLELARAGVGELRLLDGDYVDAGPTVRWPFGLSDVGRSKAEVLRDFIRAQYPYSDALSFVYELGEPAAPIRKADQHVLEEILGGVDLVFDATANLNVQRLLAELAREREIAYVMVEGRHGGWGGVIFRQIPKPGDPCWYCLQLALQPGGAIENAPAASPEGVQPRACGDVTFTGTSFDMSTIALDAVRRAVGTLCEGSHAAYPNPPGNVAVIALRNHDGTPCAPTWFVHTLRPHQECDCSAVAA